ncbi:hypothetical protein D9611_008109 [Ephemerocybe angulata]|uniref:Uncharacterized protein n=1 Tax=Ephemerocybe angulata TaxID=980116 RepID=A0A8H5FCL4_9AGAR|nr:hypothetical protein D9611_008109 [Tulosesus angulatus]
MPGPSNGKKVNKPKRRLGAWRAYPNTPAGKERIIKRLIQQDKELFELQMESAKLDYEAKMLETEAELSKDVMIKVLTADNVPEAQRVLRGCLARGDSPRTMLRELDCASSGGSSQSRY